MHPGQGQSYSADGRSEVQPDHIAIGDFIAYGGRLMPRVRGAEANGGAPAAAGDASAEGQGGGPGLYDLAEVPEHLRPAVEPHLKKIEANVTQRFQEAADFRKQWEPFQGIEGLTQLQPDALSELVAFHNEVLSDEEAFKQWWTELGQEAGWMQDVSAGDGGDNGDDELGGGDAAPEVVELRGQVEELKGLVNQLVEGQQTQEQQTRQDAAKQAIESELVDLAGKELGEGQKFDDDTRNAILTFALRYPQDPEAVSKGYADLQKLRGQSQSELVTDKLGQPDPAVRGGTADTEPPTVTSFAEAKRLARERSKAAVGAT
jgi:hypothetical protein